MDVSAQCGTTAGRGEDSVKGGKGEVGVTGLIVVVAEEEAVVKGVPEGKGQTGPGDVRTTARAVSVIACRRAEAIGVGGGEHVVEEELHARAQELS